MATLARRLQLLLDDDRYERVAAEAARRGGTVSSVIREAIDIAYPMAHQTRVVAIEHLLRHDARAEPADPDDALWGETRDALDAELAERFR